MQPQKNIFFWGVWWKPAWSGVWLFSRLATAIPPLKSRHASGADIIFTRLIMAICWQPSTWQELCAVEGLDEEEGVEVAEGGARCQHPVQGSNPAPDYLISASHWDIIMTWWHDDMMTWWHDDMMTWWHDDMMTWPWWPWWPWQCFYLWQCSWAFTWLA